MPKNDLRQRTRAFALRIIKLSGSLPANRIGDVLGRQILKSGTSIGANWREATRASSRRHFVSNTENCIREADETLYWLELLSHSAILKPARLTAITDECTQLLAILTTIAKRTKATVKSKHRSPVSFQNS